MKTDKFGSMLNYFIDAKRILEDSRCKKLSIYFGKCISIDISGNSASLLGTFATYIIRLGPEFCFSSDIWYLDEKLKTKIIIIQIKLILTNRKLTQKICYMYKSFS